MLKKAMLGFLMCCCLTFMGMPVYAFRLPDTGQHKCYDNAGNVITCPGEGQALHGQDAQYQGAEPSYRDNGNGTVTDLNTGLVWQQGDDHNNVTRNWQGACDYCDALDLGGKTDWRLPTKRELASLPIYGVYNPSINTSFFPDCRSSNYWSSSTDAGYPGARRGASVSSTAAWPATIRPVTTMSGVCVADHVGHLIIWIILSFRIFHHPRPWDRNLARPLRRWTQTATDYGALTAP